METESLVIPATYAALRVPAERLRKMLLTAHIPEATIGECELALQELLTNLVDHAYNGDDRKMITVRFQLDTQSFTIETVDYGRRAQLDLDEVGMPDPASLSEGGYGMALIKALMNDVRYENEGRRNTWRLVKLFQTSP
ncbi:MAG: ATP-binding protein [Chloroflexi bacterium]|nr:ATP-binding protein [Chloroflexota bacterium]